MRILGINLKDDQRIEMALTGVYGIGRSRAHTILDEAGVDYGTKAKALTADEENKIRLAVEVYKLEADLKREIGTNIKRLKDVKSYRGIRHMKRLPVRGQRTKTNSRTLKGVKKTMGSGKKKETKK
ncbi:MAG: 30S ribosomal protein S13 [Patescibacteria group bacterium]